MNVRDSYESWLVLTSQCNVNPMNPIGPSSISTLPLLLHKTGQHTGVWGRCLHGVMSHHTPLTKAVTKELVCAVVSPMFCTQINKFVFVEIRFMQQCF